MRLTSARHAWITLRNNELVVVGSEVPGKLKHLCIGASSDEIEWIAFDAALLGHWSLMKGDQPRI